MMPPFVESSFAEPDPATIEKLKRFAAQRGIDFTREIAPRLYEHPGVIFVNGLYQVIREDLGAWWHLSIKELRPRRSTRWQDFQQIKNELVGPEHEGVELYPARSRLVDLADQYHLWVEKDANYRFPFGFST